LFHGHSFTANPIGCAVALASLEVCLEDDVPARLDAIGAAIETELRRLLGGRAVELGLRRTGGIVAFDRPGAAGYLAGDPLALRRRALEHGVLLRPLGNTVYALPPACTTPEQAVAVAGAMATLAPA
jgi:adenosylmethionine---8-amino-7-oxononanoate aminotransferase